MVTINQLIKRPRKPKVKKVRLLALKRRWNKLHKKWKITKQPQMFGKVVEGGIKILNPSKPNSAQRACARIELRNKKQITAYIPGEKHTLQSFNVVLVCGGGAQDVPGIKYSVIRGCLDAKGVEDRKTSRSRYGTKKDKSKK